MGSIMLGFLLFMLFILIFILLFIFISLMFGAPYEPSRKKVIESMIRESRVKRGEKFVDLGSGDGRIVIAFAKAGAEAHGYEVNPFLVLLSRRKINKLGLEKKAIIHWKNFWKEDLSSFDVVGLFQVNYVMGALERKLKKELRRGSRVVSNLWVFPNWKVSRKSGKVCLYKI